jgi:hypothetical protein
MSAISVNLKLFYQRKIMWVFYIFVVFAAATFCFFLSDEKSIKFGRGLYLLPMAFMYGIGFLVSIVTMDTWGKPLVFCLPGHQKVMFLIHSGITMVCGALSLTVLIRYPSSASLHVVWFGVVLLSLNVMAYWFALFSVRPVKGGWFGLIPWILMLSYWWGGHIALERFMRHPLGMVLLSAGSWSVTGWIVKTLLRRQTRREACQMDILRQHAWHLENEKDRGCRLADIVNQWFCRQMRRQRGGIHCCIWATWYKIVGCLFLGWKTCLLLSVFLVLWMGYIRSFADPMWFVMICFIPSVMGILILSAETFIKTEGRVQRFWTAVMGSLSIQICAAVGLLGIVLLSYGLEWLLPEVTIEGRSYTCQALQWRNFAYPIGMIPVVIGLGLLLQRSFVWLAVMCISIVVLLMVPLTQDLWSADFRGLVSGLNVVAGLLSYAVFLACSYWHCFKQDLV